MTGGVHCKLGSRDDCYAQNQLHVLSVQDTERLLLSRPQMSPSPLPPKPTGALTGRVGNTCNEASISMLLNKFNMPRGATLEVNIWGLVENRFESNELIWSKLEYILLTL